MDTQTMRDCEQFIANKNAIKKVFPWDGGLIHTCCAGIYSSKGFAVDTDILSGCRNMFKSKTNIFSNFRSAVSTPLISLLATGNMPELTLDNAMAIYKRLKKQIRSSTFLPLTAMIIAQSAEPYDFDRIIERTGHIYSLMKSRHPFLTSGEDNALCALMAMSGKTDDAMISDMEECYRILKKQFSYANAVQSLSHVLALCDGPAADKCERTVRLFKTLKDSGCKYGTSYELASLGILAMSASDLNETASLIKEIASWLSKQKGFGIMSPVSKRQRLMYAGIIAGRKYTEGTAMRVTSINGVLSMIIAQQLIAASAAAGAAAAAASSST